MANLPILPFGLVEVWLGRIVFVFSIIWSAIVCRYRYFFYGGA